MKAALAWQGLAALTFVACVLLFGLGGEQNALAAQLWRVAGLAGILLLKVPPFGVAYAIEAKGLPGARWAWTLIALGGWVGVLANGSSLILYA